MKSSLNRPTLYCLTSSWCFGPLFRGGASWYPLLLSLRTGQHPSWLPKSYVRGYGYGMPDVAVETLPIVLYVVYVQTDVR